MTRRGAVKIAPVPLISATTGVWRLLAAILVLVRAGTILQEWAFRLILVARTQHRSSVIVRVVALLGIGCC